MENNYFISWATTLNNRVIYIECKIRWMAYIKNFESKLSD